MACCDGAPAALADLRGLHPPPADPPHLDALAGAGLGLALAALVILGRRYRRRPLRAAALAALDAARGLPAGERLLAQARLLDRIAGAVAPAAPAAGRAAILDRHFATDFFSAGPGAALAGGLYARAPACDPDAVEAALRPLLARLRA